MYVSDGYGNRRVVIVDAATGKYIGHFGAYGSNPVDDKAAAAAGPWMNDFTKGNMKPDFFRNPVHCVKISKEGLIYVCDRGNNRVQVFNGRDPNLGKECANPAGEAGKCGFVKEQFVAVKTNGLPGLGGVDELLDRSQADLPLRRRQLQHDDLRAEAGHVGGAGPARTERA